MRLHEVMTITSARCLTANTDLNREVVAGFASDLMSDALRYELGQSLLVTGLSNMQVVRTAEMADVHAILLVRSKTPPPETLELAREVGILMLTADMTMFEACARLYLGGLPPCRRRNGD